MSQILDSPFDEDKNCENYPYNNFSSYKACDEDFVYQQYLNKYKIMPFWVTNNTDEVTSLRSLTLNTNRNSSIFIHHEYI